MAKKSATPKKKRAGYKDCPACGNSIPARSKECACGHKFEPKAKKAVKAGASGVSSIKAVVELAKEFGGIEELELILQQAQEIDTKVGINEVRATIEQIKEIQELTK
jgi:hypothetical protein